jgi:SAM-dependent methyltransferase
VQAKVVDNDPVGLELWPALFDARGVAIPTARYRTDYADRTTIPYFNSGVLAVPAPMCEPLLAEWGAGVRWLLDHGYDQLPVRFDQLRFFTDQFALALALASLRLPVRALPLALNFPTHEPLHVASGVDSCMPVLVHHHHRLERDGQLQASPHPAPNAAIDRVNVELRRDPDAPREQSAAAAAPPVGAAVHGSGAAAGASTAAPSVRAGQAAFDNESFWDERYATNPALGSGIGSRGEIAQRKLELLRTIVDELGPSTILDVGCGDLEVVRHLFADGNRQPTSDGYTGVDISSVVLERNARILPAATFLHGDFVTLARERELHADLVLCLDVLIHQHDADHYEQFVAQLVRATRGLGVVAAYDAPPGPANSSAITAWHGPITELLLRVGARDVEVLDTYRDTAVVRYAPAT